MKKMAVILQYDWDDSLDLGDNLQVEDIFLFKDVDEAKKFIIDLYGADKVTWKPSFGEDCCDEWCSVKKGEGPNSTDFHLYEVEPMSKTMIKGYLAKYKK